MVGSWSMLSGALIVELTVGIITDDNLPIQNGRACGCGSVA